MRTAFLLSLSLLTLVACGGNVVVDVAAGSGGSGAFAGSGGTTGVGGGLVDAESIVQQSCAPNDGPAIAVWAGSGASCPPTSDVEALNFTVWGSDYLSLAPGVAFPVGPGLEVQGYRTLQMGSVVTTVVSGSIIFDSYSAGQGASGTYDVTFDDGSGEGGSFSAVWCAGGGLCG